MTTNRLEARLQPPMSIAEPTRHTAADLLEMPDGDQYELVDGQLIERNTGAESSWIAGRVFQCLSNHVKPQHLGWVFPGGASYQCFADDPERIRRPDASFIAKGRLPDEQLPSGHIRIAPDLAVEVISPNDSYYEVETKVAEHLGAGVRVVWVINPATCAVREHRADGSVRDLAGNDELSADDLLPGFLCCVAELFPPRERQS